MKINLNKYTYPKIISLVLILNYIYILVGARCFLVAYGMNPIAKNNRTRT